MSAPTLVEPEQVDDRPAGPQSSWAAAQFAKHRWWAGRVAVFPLHILTFAVATFFLVRLVPGDPARTVAGPDAPFEVYQQIREEMGLNGSIFAQLGDYLGGLLTFDLGNSLLNGRSVSAEIFDRLPGTIELAVMSFVILVSVSLLLSLVVVLRPAGILARIITGYSQIAGAIPEFVLAVAGIFLFYATLQWVPAPTGRVSPGIRQPESITGLPLFDSVLHGRWEVTGSILAHLVLPISVLVLAIAPLLLKQLLSALDEAVTAPATLFRVASGAPKGTVLLSLYRRALPPTVALMGAVFGTLLGGTVILESLFGLGGLGTYAVQSVNGNDFVALQGCLLVVAIISMTVFLLVDLTNMLLDPRRKPGAKGADR